MSGAPCLAYPAEPAPPVGTIPVHKVEVANASLILDQEVVPVRRLGGVLLVMAALLTACGSQDTGGVIEQGEQSSPEGFNAADVTFAQMMIPHHQQAVEMSDLAAERADSQEVKDLAAEIKAAQAPEIEMMTGWLEDWGEPVEGSMGGMDMGGGGGMNGMMSEEQMASLEAASGAEFDEMFLTQMREHHVGAVMMAEQELEAGQFPAAKDLAQRIVDTQRAEIEEIDRLLEV